MSPASWAAVSYLDADGNVTISSRVGVSGTVHLILADGFTLSAPKGINVTDGNSLTIYGQSEDTGTLTVNGVDENNAGIGGGNGGAGVTVSLGWTNVSDDSIYASSYNGTVTLTSGYELGGYSLNGEAIESDSFTMPSGNVTITVNLTPITYTITYDLDGGSQTLSHDYTAKEYLDTLIEDTTRSADVIALGKAIKDYGCYVQPVLADFTSVQGAIASYAISRDELPSGIESLSYALVLDSETAIEIYLAPADGYTD